MTRIFAMRELRRRGLMITAAVGVLAGLSLPARGQDAEAEPSVMTTMEVVDVQALDLADETPIFQAFGETYTKVKWEKMVRDYPPAVLRSKGLMRFEIGKASPPRVLEAIQSWCTEQAAARHARELGLPLDLAESQHLEREKGRFMRNIWADKVGLSETAEPTEERVRQYYEENKSMYARPEQFQMRHIFVPTYQYYTVEEGDSLESIAEKIAGDVSLADKILDDKTKKPRSENVTDVNGEEMPAQALQVGEQLLVPATREKQEESKRRIDEAYNQLREGLEFTEVAAQYSDSKEPGRLVVVERVGQQDILPIITETFLELEDGEFSEPLRTKHGWQIVYREKHLMEGVQPFEEVNRAARRQVQREMQAADFEKVFNQLWLQFRDRVEINEEALENVFDAKYAGATLLKAGDLEYPVTSFLSDFSTHLSEETPVAQRLEMLSRLPQLRQQLFNWSVEQYGITESDDFLVKVKSLEDIFYSNAYYRKRIEELKVAPTKEQIREEYEANLEAFKKPATVSVRYFHVEPEISEGASDEQRQEILNAEVNRLADRLADVSSEEAFANRARTLGETDDAARGGSAGVVGADFMDGLGQRLADEASPGSVFPPLVIDGRVYAFWVGEKTAGSTTPLEEASQKIEIRLSRLAEEEARQKVSQELLGEADLVLLVDKLKELNEESK